MALAPVGTYFVQDAEGRTRDAAELYLTRELYDQKRERWTPEAMDLWQSYTAPSAPRECDET